MKYILALLLTLSFPSQADVMTLKNDGAGEIVLTLEACPISEEKELKYAYAYSKNTLVHGCWLVEKAVVVVGWVIENKIKYKTYDAADFKLKKTI